MGDGEDRQGDEGGGHCAAAKRSTPGHQEKNRRERERAERRCGSMKQRTGRLRQALMRSTKLRGRMRALKSYRQGRERGRFPALDSNMLEQFRPANRAEAVSDSDTSEAENGRNPPIPTVRETATHIATPWGEGRSGRPCGWWEPDWTRSIGKLVFFAHLGANGSSANQGRTAV